MESERSENVSRKVVDTITDVVGVVSDCVRHKSAKKNQYSKERERGEGSNFEDELYDSGAY